MSEESKLAERIEQMTRRLDALLRITLEDQKIHDEETTIGDQILLLEDAGLSPSDVGGILGIDSRQLFPYIRKAKNKKLKLKVEKRRQKPHE